METPLVVIAGRPNVGKSSLFNRLVGRRQALVADQPGLTRDRQDAVCTLGGRLVRIADTAGLEEAPPESLSGRMRAGAASILEQADLIVFVVDARAGILPPDAHFGTWLRRLGRPVLLVANKTEGRAGYNNALDAYTLGLGEPLSVSAEHGEGISHLMSTIAEMLPAPAAPEEGSEHADVTDGLKPLRLVILGRPNAGKSTLVNRLLGEDRMLTGPEPGITRDAITLPLHDADGRSYQLVDTAGLRRRARVQDDVEKLSTGASINAMRFAEVVVLVVDAADGLHDQDLQIARLVEREGRAMVVALNKWDAVEDRDATRKAVADRLERSLAQLKGIPVVTLSAVTGANVAKLLPAVRAVHDTWNKRIATSALNRWFEDAISQHPPPAVQGRRLKLRYITQANARPPTFVVFGTRAEATPEDYRRYLVNALREVFVLPGTPIRLDFRGTVNPFSDKG
ncbi:MAG: ribosome biogenesis GTPase Der [Proteobacteria bacterium]|nr:ribosome biogenesis GTPase Der [Pseudomonadota bacterium]